MANLFFAGASGASWDDLVEAGRSTWPGLAADRLALVGQILFLVGLAECVTGLV